MVQAWLFQSLTMPKRSNYDQRQPMQPSQQLLTIRWFGLAACSLLLVGCFPAVVTKSPGAFGRIIDARTHAAVASARVSFPALRMTSATTDQDGRYDLPYRTKLGIIVLLPFEFQNVMLEASHPGYQPKTERVFYASPPHQRHDMVLQPSEGVAPH